KCTSGTVTAFSPWYTFSTNGACRGTDEFSSTEEDPVKIFPNPFSNELSILLPLQDDEAITINLYDVCGRKVLSENFDHASAGINHFSFDASSLAEGVYVCLIQTGEGIVARR